jgi:DNA-binding NarL/FixJ family response regulator
LKKESVNEGPTAFAASDEVSDPLPAELRAVRFRIEHHEYVLISFPLIAQRRLEVLTEAEREVALLMLEGASNAEIARARGSAVRTVANQAASIFRKLGVCSRRELAALCAPAKDIGALR